MPDTSEVAPASNPKFSGLLAEFDSMGELFEFFTFVCHHAIDAGIYEHSDLDELYQAANSFAHLIQSRNADAVLAVDGGVRGQGQSGPQEAAVGYVLETPDGLLLEKGNEFLGRTNECNIRVEYRSLLLGLDRAYEADVDISHLHVQCDVDSIVRQIWGLQTTSHADLQAFQQTARESLARFDNWSLTSIDRANNTTADRLVTKALKAHSTL